MNSNFQISGGCQWTVIWKIVVKLKGGSGANIVVIWLILTKYTIFNRKELSVEGVVVVIILSPEKDFNLQIGDLKQYCVANRNKQCKREQEKAEISKVNDFRLQIPLFTNVTTTGI